MLKKLILKMFMRKKVFTGNYGEMLAAKKKWLLSSTIESDVHWNQAKQQQVVGSKSLSVRIISSQRVVGKGYRKGIGQEVVVYLDRWVAEKFFGVGLLQAHYDNARQCGLNYT